MTLENNISSESTTGDGTQPAARPARRRAVRTAAPAGAPVTIEPTPTPPDVLVAPVADDDAQVETSASKRPTRSRRAVRTTPSTTAPASALVDEVPVTPVVPVEESAEPSPTEAPARRSRARTTPAPVADDQDVPKTRTRRRATAPRAVETTVALESAPEVEPESPDAVESTAQVGTTSVPEPGAGAPRRPNTTLLFQAPDPTAARPRRRRASTPAGSPEAVSEAAGAVHAELALMAAATEAEPDTSTSAETTAARDGSPDESATTSGRARRSRRGGGRRTPDEPDVVESVVIEDDESEPDVDDSGDEIELGDGAELDEGAPRRRRRRGGRGRRGRASGEGDDNQDQDGTDEDLPVGDDEASEGAASEGAAGEPVEDETGTGSSRRRRRRRRSGRGGDGDTEQTASGSGGTVRGRQPRPVNDEVTALRGSTRLEAKRQRRREGRDAGRRRTIVTESEFLARRESVDRSMVVREVNGLTQIAVLEDGVLVEHYISSQSQASMAGNVYLGRVQNVLPSMEAAFVDVGKGRNAVLYAGEVNWDAAGMEGQPRRIEQALKSGDPVLVQVTKDPIGHKGARLTSQVTLAGRYLVYVPGGGMTGISRKLPEPERARLKKLLREIVPDSAGVIVRTAAEGASEDELRADIDRLQAQWAAIEKKAKSASAPALLQGEPDLAIRVVRDIFNDDFGSLVVQGGQAWDTVSGYIGAMAPDLAAKVSRWTGTGDVFAEHRVDEQLSKALGRKVWLPSGGSLVIDKTEAMTVIDVNTGKFVGSGGTLEETVTRNNLEAAEEIVRQLRLRDVGGIIVIDFIDMVLESNRDLVLRRLVECLGRDRTKHQVAEVTSLGLVQMTRKRVGQGLAEAFGDTVPGQENPGARSEASAMPETEVPGDGRRPRRKRGGSREGAASGDSGTTVVPVLPEAREAVKATLATIAAAAAHAHEHAHDDAAHDGGAGHDGGAHDDAAPSQVTLDAVAASLQPRGGDLAAESAEPTGEVDLALVPVDPQVFELDGDEDGERDGPNDGVDHGDGTDQE
ncbi:MAG TPA: Rne/Rng family ribonuclease [Cellulomonadaceae bacterium]|nr:Rne/Rng family ribonuclease [Cellulomonadaceae bacterium]